VADFAVAGQIPRVEVSAGAAWDGAGEHGSSLVMRADVLVQPRSQLERLEAGGARVRRRVVDGAMLPNL